MANVPLSFDVDGEPVSTVAFVPDAIFAQQVAKTAPTTGSAINIFSKTVDDELTDWINKLDIDILSLAPWATKVEITVEAKHGQTGADNPIYARFNNDNGANYDGAYFSVGASSITPNDLPGETFIRGLPSARQAVTTGEVAVFTISPKSYGKYPMAEIVRTFRSSVAVYQGYSWAWKNTIDDITSVQIYTANSTKSSFIITVRAWA